MNRLKIDLENCYGIKKLNVVLDFSVRKAFAIYAPNGSMKSSLAQTFKDLADGTTSKDRIFPARPCTRNIADESGALLSKESVLVIRPYDEVFGHTEKTSTLLVDAKLRKEYEQLNVDIDKAQDTFLKALKEQSKTKKDIATEIASTFTTSPNEFFKALLRIENELQTQRDAPLADIHYDTIFDDKVLSLLETKDFKTLIAEYTKKYTELLGKSTYFKRGTFNYYNAETVAKSLADNGFFDASHTVNLNAGQPLVITTQKQLVDLISREKESITNDKDLRKKFAEIEKLLNKNVTVRDFHAYLGDHEELLPKLADIPTLREELWKSYIKVRYPLYEDLITKYRAAEKRKKEIVAAANTQRTQWEAVIDIFNDRFVVPFKLTAKNRTAVILGEEPMLTLGFTFDDGHEQATVEKPTLMQALSTGEKKALYILNIIFEVEVRRKASQDTIFVVDDIADSFDYKNKYAIIQYLQDIDEDPHFKQVILTHNFDFFRTIQSRFVRYDHCLMANKNTNGITLDKATGIQNVFVKDWKINFFTNQRKRIASIPFIRNIIEYTKGEQDADFAALTALLHWKANSWQISHSDLDSMYNKVFGGTEVSPASSKTVVESIHEEAAACLNADTGINFENKIVLSIAIRLAAEQYMIDRINDSEFVDSITSNQTRALLSRFRTQFKNDTAAVHVLQRVALMTPENIHLNSFMYEPILDMSDEHLRKLYQDVNALNATLPKQTAVKPALA
ncbi:ATP-binding protein [Paludibaculum fermentans]|uniref:Phage infection protein n=1 Tax=Paludibaculum fermentans TaxID=1473598 RepID=A0A7S7NRU9_PALFE|nr:phage infection protein [Paludibaculum fermentans]QOY88682.1 phage infection protein [Paludibaculum fermentans]